MSQIEHRAGPGLTLTFAAHLIDIDTDEEILDPAVLAPLGGIRERSDLADFARAGALDGQVVLRTAIPTLKFDRATGRLRVVIAFVTERETTERDAELIAAFCLEQIQGSWGCNTEWPLPQSLENCTIHFDDEPLGRTPVPSAAAMQRIADRWRGWSFATLEALPDTELAALLAELEPYPPRNRATGVSQEIGMLYEATKAQYQRRFAARTGRAQVSVDDLDGLDDLADDEF